MKVLNVISDVTRKRFVDVREIEFGYSLFTRAKGQRSHSTDGTSKLLIIVLFNDHLMVI